MDIQLARTFLAIVAEGNFGAASSVLNVTQSAVSLRVRKLEDTLGQRLFERTRAGITLTPAGQQFERYAISLVRIWEEARQQVAVPSGFSHTMKIGGQYSLLPRLVMRWLRRLEIALPDTAFRVDAGMPERLMRMLMEGSIDIAVMYTPQMRPGVAVEELYEEELVLVSPFADRGGPSDDSYIFCDWGPEFVAAHGIAFPDRAVSRLTLAVGPLGVNYMIREGRSGYLPARVARDHLKAGRLHLVPDAPTFAFPCYVVWNSEIERERTAVALEELRRIVAGLDDMQDDVLQALEDVSEDDIQSMQLY